jgi:transcriptional regulator with XRE-family HTH domain
MKDRLLKIIKNYNLTSSRFADELGVQRSGISHILSGRNQPSYDFIVKLLKRYPEIDPDWLLVGKGRMYRSPASEKAGAEPDLFNSTEVGYTPDIPAESPEMTERSKPAIVTNVTDIQQIVIFYPDGTFKPYLPIAND